MTENRAKYYIEYRKLNSEDKWKLHEGHSPQGYNSMG